MLKNDFGWAIRMLKDGHRVQRKGWNGRNMYVFMRSGKGYIKGHPELPHLCMKTADDKCCVGWLASQSDMLGEDWELY